MEIKQMENSLDFTRGQIDTYCMQFLISLCSLLMA
jgi:hypothetical protein